MKKSIYTLRAIHPPILLAAISISTFDYLLGSNLICLSIGILLGLVFFFDALNRHHEYKQLPQLLSKCSEEDILRKYRHSWCTREMVKAYLASLSREKYNHAYLHYRNFYGIKWYHIFPQNTFSRNSVFLKKKFWKNTFLSFKN